VRDVCSFSDCHEQGFALSNVELVVFDEFDRLFDASLGKFVGQVRVLISCVAISRRVAVAGVGSAGGVHVSIASHGAFLGDARSRC
jgi:hypothetical protein